MEERVLERGRRSHAPDLGSTLAGAFRLFDLFGGRAVPLVEIALIESSAGFRAEYRP
jgi:hypothetical protein